LPSHGRAARIDFAQLGRQLCFDAGKQRQIGNQKVDEMFRWLGSTGVAIFTGGF